MAKKIYPYTEINKLITTICNFNALCMRSCEQSAKTSFYEVSPRAHEWLKAKSAQQAIARVTLIQNIKNKFAEGINIANNKILEASKIVFDEFNKVYPNEATCFEDLIDLETEDFTNEHLAKMYEQYVIARDNGAKKKFIPYLTLGEAIDKINGNIDAISIYKEISKLIEPYEKDLTKEGNKSIFTFKNVSHEIRLLSFDTVCDLKDIVDESIALSNVEYVKAGVELTKISKKLYKDPENNELKEAFNTIQNKYFDFEAKLKFLQPLKVYADCFYDRIVASNTPKTPFIYEMYEVINDALNDVSKEYKEKLQVPICKNAYVTLDEAASVLNLLNNFTMLAPLSQQIAHETDLSLSYDIVQNPEYVAEVIEALTEDYNVKMEDAKNKHPELNKTELKNSVVNPEVCKRLRFVSPVGGLWFDGVRYYNFETNEPHEVSEINEIVIKEIAKQQAALQENKAEQPKQAEANVAPKIAPTKK